MTISREKPGLGYRPTRNLPRPEKKKHILKVMEDLTESGVGGMTTQHLADRSGYTPSPSFRDLLFEMVDEGLIFSDTKRYYGGVCPVRHLFYLPEVWATKKAIKKMRDRDRRS